MRICSCAELIAVGTREITQHTRFPRRELHAHALLPGKQISVIQRERPHAFSSHRPHVAEDAVQVRSWTRVRHFMLNTFGFEFLTATDGGLIGRI